jgi:site-specific DNA-methyltransferase (adenine-specific)
LTPKKIVKDMEDMLSADEFTPETTFLDPAVKSGRFLVELQDRLMAAPALISRYPNEKERQQHIWREQLFGLATSETAATISRKNLYDRADLKGNIRYIDNYIGRMKQKNIDFKAMLEEEFGPMKFDVVIGNPPYNNDLYIQFVRLGHKISKDCTIMITPAKWQAKGGKDNEDFRREIVPYMSKIVYYPDCSDIFTIGDPGGISYYLIIKQVQKLKSIRNISNKQKIYNDIRERTFEEFELYNIGYDFVRKIFGQGVKPINIETLDENRRYQVWSANKLSMVSNIPKTYLWSMDGMFYCLGLQQIVDKNDTLGLISVPDDSRLIFSSENIDECKSFISWCYTRFIRYMLSLSLCGVTGIATSNEWWRFVPDPGKFDHIFTDQELYTKYNLTQQEINIIESVIKERKQA